MSKQITDYEILEDYFDNSNKNDNGDITRNSKMLEIFLL